MSGPVDVLNTAATYASHAAIAAERIGNGEVEDMDGVRRAFLRIAAGLSGAAEASAAVAELIEKSRAVEQRLIPLLSGRLQNIGHDDFVAFFAALANVGGAK